MTSETPATGTVECHECGQTHEATYSHEGRYGEGPIYAVVCTEDWLTSYYTTEVVEFPDPQPVPAALALDLGEVTP